MLATPKAKNRRAFTIQVRAYLSSIFHFCISARLVDLRFALLLFLHTRNGILGGPLVDDDNGGVQVGIVSWGIESECIYCVIRTDNFLSDVILGLKIVSIVSTLISLPTQRLCLYDIP